MLRLRSILMGAATALAIGVTGLAGSPAFAHDGWDHDRHEWREHEWREHEWREHEWREHHWRPAYYREHYWVGPGYYWGPAGWVYYDAPFPAYEPAPAPVYAPAPYAPVAGLNVVVPLHIR